MRTSLLIHAYGVYTTNLPLEDLLDGQAWIGYEGEELAAEHGGPARLLTPHVYLWKPVHARLECATAGSSRYPLATRNARSLRRASNSAL